MARASLVARAAAVAETLPTGHQLQASILEAPRSRIVQEKTEVFIFPCCMSSNLRCPLATLRHPGLCEKSHRSPLAHSLPWVHPTLARQIEDLRVETFYVTLPPRTSSGPLNAKTRKNKVSAARHRIAGATTTNPAGVFFMLKEKTLPNL